MTKRIVSGILIFIYGALLFRIMVMKNIPMIRVGHMRFRFGGTQEGSPNFVPFRTIQLYLHGGGWIISGLNLFGNILLLVPIGFLAPFLYPNMGWRRAVLLGIASGLAIEGLQTILHVGIFDVDDIILNGFGVVVGFWAYLLFQRVVQKVGSRRMITAAVCATAIAGIFLFVYVLRHGQLPVGIGTGSAG